MRVPGVAAALPAVQAAALVLGGDPAWRADAAVARVSVNTPAAVTAVPPSRALVLVLSTPVTNIHQTSFGHFKSSKLAGAGSAQPRKRISL